MNILPFHDPRPTDRKPQASKHCGPYYPVDAMKRLATAVDQPSIVERLYLYWESHEWPAWAVIVVMAAAIGFGIVYAV